MDSIATKKRLTRIAACIQYHFPDIRKYFYYDSVPIYDQLRTVDYALIEINTLYLIDPKGNRLELFIDEEFRVPDYPYSFVFEAWTKDCLQLGWLYLRLCTTEQGIRALEQEWIPNTSYELPEYRIKEFEIILTSPIHFL